MYSGKRSPEALERRRIKDEQHNQRVALKYYIKITAYKDSDLQELVNTCTTDDNFWFLNTTFGVVDSGIIPSYAFDGCVLESNRGDGALQK